jgi:hypothetical protein
MKTKYERKLYLKNLKQENHSGDPLQVTYAELSTFLGVLVKIGIRMDMKKRGIEDLEDYTNTLLKEFSQTSN